MRILMVDEGNLEQVQKMIHTFVQEVQNLNKSGPGRHLVSIALHPFATLIE